MYFLSLTDNSPVFEKSAYEISIPEVIQRFAKMVYIGIKGHGCSVQFIFCLF